MEERTQWVGLLRDDPPTEINRKAQNLAWLQPQEPTLGLQAEQRLEVQGDEGRDGPSTVNNLAAHQKGIKTDTQTDTPMQACLRESRTPVKRMTLTAEQVRHPCSVQLLVVSDSLRPHGLQHARPPCPPPIPGVYPNPCPSSQ